MKINMLIIVSTCQNQLIINNYWINLIILLLIGFHNSQINNNYLKIPHSTSQTFHFSSKQVIYLLISIKITNYLKFKTIFQTSSNVKIQQIQSKVKSVFNRHSILEIWLKINQQIIMNFKIEKMIISIMTIFQVL